MARNAGPGKPNPTPPAFYRAAHRLGPAQHKPKNPASRHHETQCQGKAPFLSAAVLLPDTLPLHRLTPASSCPSVTTGLTPVFQHARPLESTDC